MLILRFASTYSRVPPRSLLIKQAIRLGKIKPPSNDQLITHTLRDLKSMFQPSANTQEEDDLDMVNKQNKISEQITNGKYKSLLTNKLGYVDGEFRTDILVSGFRKLNLAERELIIDATEYQYPKDTQWDELPLYVKQLEYYIGFGSYGPRNLLPFNKKSNSIPVDFIFQKKSKIVTDLKQIVKKLPKEHISTYQLPGEENGSDKLLDSYTKFLGFFLVLVTGICAVDDYIKKTQKEEIVVVY